MLGTGAVLRAIILTPINYVFLVLVFAPIRPSLLHSSVSISVDSAIYNVLQTVLATVVPFLVVKGLSRVAPKFGSQNLVCEDEALKGRAKLRKPLRLSLSSGLDVAEFLALEQRLNSHCRFALPSINDVFLSGSSSNQSNWDSSLPLDFRNELSRLFAELRPVE